MNMDTTAIYWLTFSEIEELYNSIMQEIEQHASPEILNRILLEINIAIPREKSSILPSDFIVSIMDLPDKALPLRFTFEEVSIIKTMNVSNSLLERLE